MLKCPIYIIVVGMFISYISLYLRPSKTIRISGFDRKPLISNANTTIAIDQKSEWFGNLTCKIHKGLFNCQLCCSGCIPCSLPGSSATLWRSSNRTCWGNLSCPIPSLQLWKPFTMVSNGQTLSCIAK